MRARASPHRRISPLGFLLRALVNAAAIGAAAWLLDGVRLDGVVSALVAGAVLGIVNALVRPVLLVLTFPLTLVTLGLFIFVLNGLCLWLTSAVVPGFTVTGFWPAVGAALVVTVVSWALTTFVADSGRLQRLG
ncbi:MAG TPA: phage holin family protein [Candidatus Tectomicrobia bacterium]|nr:phage holin family protein [Candidatus Tectomicrobia bacterium]